ncbi:hypothetical protein C8P66_11783 [Humitalea rosea]|uniref:Membrane-bound lysozyme inhibitor of c-type lysozyme MliC n=1 Tax=Humitalea rosea TaxID=990373 RepID=A0A2W7IUA4_9PROT|nr:hypothetical protein [Humitalea rosea]PZW43057.1 hypothetical protein C8P66_11783 [Humitalea rosea]
MVRTFLRALGLALALAPAAALADSIDGFWCSEAGLRLSIQGPALVSPGAARLSGNYSRHAFTYQAPAGEPGGGGEVRMQLLGEDMVRVDAATGGMEPVWRRCGPPVS